MAVLQLPLPGKTGAVVAYPDGAELHEQAAQIISRALIERPDAVAVTADAIIDGVSRRRSGWSPTAIIGDPTELTLLAVRDEASTPFGDGSAAERLNAASQLHAHVSTVLHIPAPLVRGSRESMDSAAKAAIDAWAWSSFNGALLTGGDRVGTFRLLPTQTRTPVTVVIPTAGVPGPDGVPLVHEAIRLARAEGSHVSVVVVVGDEYLGDPASLDDQVTVIHRPPGSFNFSSAVNLGILHADSDQVLLLNDDISGDQPGWLDQMQTHLSDPTVGAVGALLRYPDHSIQHAGIVIDNAHPMHSFVGQPVDALARHHADIARDVIAVTGACMLIRRADLLAVGACSTVFPLAFNDIDLCLKLHRHGRRVILEPTASLIHHESASRQPVMEAWEWDRYIRRWGHVDDPWYHPGHARPDDPLQPRLNADHLDPDEVPFMTEGRDTTIRSRVHHSPPALSRLKLLRLKARHRLELLRANRAGRPN